MTLRRLRPLDALKTYRYLRLGTVASVLLLGISLILEIKRVGGCLLGSISAYYYTPVRPIFVGVMFVVGAFLIAYKGRTRGEDVYLNVAGMLAPLVAVAPTWEDISNGLCKPFVSQSPFKPDTDPADRVHAEWVITSIDNNARALLIVGVVSVAFALFVWWWNVRNAERFASEHPQWAREVEPGTGRTVFWTGAGLVAIAGAWIVDPRWFIDDVHGKAAELFFVFLWLAVLANVIAHRREAGLWVASGGGRLARSLNYLRNVFAPRPPSDNWERRYRGIALLMILGLTIPLSKLLLDAALSEGAFWEYHHTFWLEAWEIFVFALYWGAQTVENWFEDIGGDGES